MKPSWTSEEVAYPNGDKVWRTSIMFGSGAGASYDRVEGGFVIDRYRRNAKVYPDQATIRRVLLKRLRADVRKLQTAIDQALSEVS
jgi:hypothetical protein